MEAAGETQFTGYDQWESEGRVKGLLRDGESVTSAAAGELVEVVLDRSPFYAEAGGQLGDHGLIRLDDGTTLQVDDVQTPVPGLWVHRARVIDGEAAVGAAALGIVDVERRRAISRAHTATHMIHKTFREMLGETATQMGSENAPGRLRFDFPYPKAVPDTVLRDAEERVNTLLLEDMTVTARYMSQAEALEMGAMALFGEKYGDTVRVVSVGDWAHELCGGTHAHRSGQLGVVSFVSRGLRGLGGPPGGGPGRLRCLPVPGPRAPVGLCAQLDAEEPAGGPRGPGRRDRGEAQERRAGVGSAQAAGGHGQHRQHHR